MEKDWVLKTPNDAVEKVFPSAYFAVNQIEYQGSNEVEQRGPGMARYKLIDTSPRFIAVDLQRQVLPGFQTYWITGRQTTV